MDSTSSQSHINQSTLWMGDLESYMDEEFILQSFRTMGEGVTRVKPIISKHTRAPAGYCFVEFTDPEAAHRAMLRLNSKIIPNSNPPKRYKLNHAGFGRVHLTQPEYSVFVGDISDDVDDFTLYQVFVKKYKSCKGAKIVMDMEGKSRGYGFVRFSDESDQQNAVSEMQGYAGVGTKAIRVSMATPKRTGNSNQTYSNSYSQQAYYPQSAYPQYYNPATWWNTYQQPMYYGANYGDQYTQQQPNHQVGAQFDQAASRGDNSAVYTSEDDDSIEEPITDIDVKLANKEFMQRSEEVYIALESSRWQPVDSVLAPISLKT